MAHVNNCLSAQNHIHGGDLGNGFSIIRCPIISKIYIALM